MACQSTRSDKIRELKFSISNSETFVWIYYLAWVSALFTCWTFDHMRHVAAGQATAQLVGTSWD